MARKKVTWKKKCIRCGEWFEVPNNIRSVCDTCKKKKRKGK